MDETTKKRLHDQLDSLIESTRQRRKLDVGEAIDFESTIKELVLKKFGPDPQTLGKDVWKIILSQSIDFSRPCLFSAIPTVCKLWKEIYIEIEEIRLEEFLEASGYYEIWQIIFLYSLEMGIIRGISTKEVCSGHRIDFEYSSITFEAYCEHDSCEDASPRRNFWSILSAYRKADEIFDCLGHGNYVIELCGEEKQIKHQKFYDFIRKYIQDPTTWGGKIYWEKRDELDTEDPQLKQVLLEINKTRKIF